MKVIINADDLGMSPEANDAIGSLMESGRLTSATIMANGPAVEAAVARARSWRNCSLGVHLNLTEFQPLTDSAALSPVLNAQGCFDYELLRAAAGTARLKDALVKEWCAQVNRVRAMGITVSHLDSHHHVHTLPKLFSVLKRVQRECGLRKVRRAWNIYPAAMPPTWARQFKKQLWTTALRCCSSTVTTEGFASLRVVATASARQLQQLRTIEVMVHPGHSYYVAETALLASDWWEQISIAIEPINYHQL